MESLSYHSDILPVRGEVTYQVFERAVAVRRTVV